MEIIFQRTKTDFIQFLSYWYFERKLLLRLFIIIVASFWVGPSLEPFLGLNSFTCTLIMFIGYLIVTVLSYLIYLFLLEKKLKRKKHFLEEVIFSFNEVGISFKTDSVYQSILWEEITKIENSKAFIFISWGFRKNIFIPKHFFSSLIQADHFNDSMQKIYLPKRAYFKTINGKHLYKWGFLGLIPNVGIFSGIYFAIKGVFVFKDKNLVLIGLGNIVFTFLFWFIVFMIANNSQSVIDSKKTQTSSNLNSVVKHIEEYKAEKNMYPDSLSQLIKIGHFLADDPMDAAFFHKRSFIYKRLDDQYTLYSVGVDHIADTNDDIYPSDTLNMPGFIRIK